MAIRIHPHAKERMLERGTTETEVIAAVAEGEHFLAQYGRTGFRRNFSFPQEWRSKKYRMKQLEVIAVQEEVDWVVLTVVTRYF